MEHLKKNLILALSLGIAVYLMLAILSGFTDLQVAFAGFRWSLLPLILGLVAFSYAVRFVRWSYYLRILAVTMPPQMNVAIFVAGLSITNSPGKFGGGLKNGFIRQVSGAAIARTAPAVIAERVPDATGMLAWGLLGALAFSLGPRGVLLFLAITAIGIAGLRSKRLSILVESMLLKLPFLHRLAQHLG